MDLPDDLTGFIGRFNIQSWLIHELNFHLRRNESASMKWK